MSYVKNKIALVTGANRGIGRAFVEELLDAGIKKVYATARDISKLEDLVKENPGRVVPIGLDVTNEKSITAAADQINDVDLLINNAGIASTITGAISLSSCLASRLSADSKISAGRNKNRTSSGVN